MTTTTMASSISIYDLLGIIADFEETFDVNDAKMHDKIVSHLQRMDKIHFLSPEFGSELDWLNVSQPLKIYDHLKGNIVILDFFTYCCINCMHILPDLKIVEEKYPMESGVIVVGVHSAKFLNEKVTSNILSAVLRYNILHPVVNDKNATMWQDLAVSCWPTLIFLGPKGQLIHSISGEGQIEKVLLFLEAATHHYSSELHPNKLPISLAKDTALTSHLKYPGKICFWAEKNELVITDTGNHRIIVADVNGIVQTVIGSGQSGFKDGLFETAEFSSPQGVTCDSQNIYVADTGNHCIRKIAFDGSGVKTIAGTGYQGSDKQGGNLSTSQVLSSPWDVLIGENPDGSTAVLYIAMAGSHQIWVYFLSDTLWFNKSYEASTCMRFAGSGQEENRNNSYPEKASFAQPSGLALSSKDPRDKLYIADSESSSIRYISIIDGKVSGLVGGELDPNNLFAFGDVDGKGIKAKLQHPLGVALLDEKLIVADSYNHKIKMVDLNTSICETLAGTGYCGSSVFADDLRKSEFNEPGGVAVDSKNSLIYIADTNNHDIKVIDLDHRKISKLPIIFPTEDENDRVESSSTIPERGEYDLVSIPDIVWRKGISTITLSLPLKLTEEEHVNTEAPNRWIIEGLDVESGVILNSLDKSHRKGSLETLFTSSTKEVAFSLTLKLPLDFNPKKLTMKISVHLFVCDKKSNICLPPRWLHFKQIIICDV